MDNNPNYDQLLQDLCVPGANWERGAGNKPKFIKRTDLTPEAKGWFELVRRSILPAANNSEVNLERATMVHCILKGGEIKVHEIIAQGIRKMAEKSDARGTIPRTSKEAKKEYRPSSSGGQALEGQAPQTLDMHQLQEAINGLSRQYLEGQGAQRELQLQMMEQQQSQGQQWGETFNRMEQRQNEQQESIQRLINIQAHQGAHIHEMHRRQIEHTELLDEQRAFAEGVYMSETGHHINTQARLGYLVGQLPILHPEIARYEEMKDELARRERQRVEESHESVRKALADWKQARLARLQGSARGHKEDQQGKEHGQPHE
ncbi:hypothetical protein Ahy_A03g013061 [Arachis hypogaea]|uniref:Putative plant transposon protein domain-containing protein n=1 Tax=Arachis hypogaea TaxID=3818 RepID=A0A445DUP8_ARAHY|nr:hypothetical protein Ahy_A03g013061 [Arachis hypogaea]